MTFCGNTSNSILPLISVSNRSGPLRLNWCGQSFSERHVVWCVTPLGRTLCLCSLAERPEEVWWVLHSISDWDHLTSPATQPKRDNRQYLMSWVKISDKMVLWRLLEQHFKDLASLCFCHSFDVLFWTNCFMLYAWVSTSVQQRVIIETPES